MNNPLKELDQEMKDQKANSQTPAFPLNIKVVKATDDETGSADAGEMPPVALRSKAKKFVPERLRMRFHAWKKELNAQRTTNLDGIQEVLRSLDSEPMINYTRRFLQGSDSLKGMPDNTAEIEINDSCNIDCVMCKTSLATRKKGLMSFELFDLIMKKMSARGITHVTLHTIGDPLANKKLASYLEIMRKYRMKVPKLTTNALLLNRHLDTIFEYRDVIEELMPSIDGASKETYEKIRAGGSWEDLHQNLTQFAERNRELGQIMPVSMSSVISKDNFHEIGFIPATFSYLTRPYYVSYSFINSLSPDNAYFLSRNYFENEYQPKEPCESIWRSIYVHKEGNLSACPRDYHGDLVFGNMRNEDIDEAYEGEKIRKMRQAHLDRNNGAKPKLCQTCYVVDPRYTNVIDLTVRYFYLRIQKHPAYLQLALNQIGGALKDHQFGKVMDVVRAL